MKINNSIKAIIINGTRLLVNECKAEDGSIFYTLPGGKQRPDELMLDALKRETLEETGYAIENITREPLDPAELRGIIKRHFLGKPNDIYLGEMK